DHQASLATTRPTHQNARPGGEAKRLPNYTASWARKPVQPTSLLKPGSASAIIREKPLKLGKRFWERQVGAVENVHNTIASQPLRVELSLPSGQVCSTGLTLDIVGVCVNRIGTVRSLPNVQSVGVQRVHRHHVAKVPQGNIARRG